MEWYKKFEVGHEKIDLEHKVFFSLVQSAESAVATSENREKIRRILTELVKYAEFHFISEENLMIDISYPDFESHHEHHNQLMKQLNHYIVKFEVGEDNIQELIDFLYDWFVKHTTHEDLMLSRYIKKMDG